MKIISSRNPTVETLTLGALGSTLSYTLYGDAKFPNGQTSLTITGIQQVDVTLAPNTATSTKFVELFQGARRVETYAVQSPNAVRIDQFSLRGVNEWASDSLTGPLTVRDMAAGTETDVSALPLVAGAIRDVFIVPCTYSNKVHFMQANATEPTRLLTVPTGAVPVGMGAHRNATTDERTFLIIDSAGTVYYVSHDMAVVPPTRAIPIPAGTFIESAVVRVDAAGAASAIVVALSNGVLAVYPLTGTALVPQPGDYIQSSKSWVRVVPLSGQRILAIADDESDNSALVTGLTLSAYKSGLVYGVSRNQSGTSYFVAEGNQPVARNEADGAVIPFTYYGLPVPQNYPGTEFASSTGTDYQLSGKTVGYAPFRNPVAFHTMGGKLYGYCQPRSLNHTMGLINTADHAATLTEVDRIVVGDTLTITLRVNCAASTWIPVVPASSSKPTFKVGTDPTRMVKNGDLLVVSVAKPTMRDNTLVFGVGRAVFEAQAIPDAVPDQFDVQDIEPINPGENRLTEYIVLTGYDTATPVHSSGIIYIDDVEVADGTLIRPGQSLRILITQSDNFVDDWWVDVGGVRADFTSSQEPQPFTIPTKNRAYANLGEKVISKLIINTHGIPVAFKFKSDVGYLAQYPTMRSVVLAPGAQVNIILEVDKYAHFDIPYRFGRSDHTWMVWADDHFLDPEPVTVDADRAAEASSPPFPFGAFPPNFYAIAKVPAGVRATVAGAIVPGQLDARGYLHGEHEIEFDLSSPVVYTAIPFESGRTLDFGDVVAHWNYDPDISVYKMLKRVEYIKPKSTVVAPVQSFTVRTSAPIDDVAPVPFVLYPLRKHEVTSSPRSSSTAMSQFAHVEVAAYTHNTKSLPVVRESGTSAEVAIVTDVVEASSKPTVESLQCEFVQRGSHAAPHVEYERASQETATGPESFNFSLLGIGSLYGVQAATAKAMQIEMPKTEDLGARPTKFVNSFAEGITIHPDRPEPPTSEGLEVDPQVATRNVVYCEALEIGQVTTGTGVQVDTHYNVFKPGAVQTVPIRSLVKTLPINGTVPIRALTMTFSVGGSVTLQPTVTNPPSDHDIRNTIIGASNFPTPGRNSVTIATLFWRDPKTPSAVPRAQASQLTAFNPRPSFTAQQVSPAPVKHPTFNLDAQAAQLAPRYGIEPDIALRMPQLSYSYAKRLFVAPVTDAHDGNPDYLQRGYFATEVEALQDAVNVWGMLPIDVHAQQREGGEWYWMQTSKCVNMCDGCPPYGYISGG